MSTFHKAGCAILSGFGVALLATLALASGCASDDAVGAPARDDDASSVSDANAVVDAAFTSATPGIFACVLETGKPGSIVVLDDPAGHGPCAITARLIGSSKRFCDDDACPQCKDLLKQWDCPLM